MIIQHLCIGQYARGVATIAHLSKQERTLQMPKCRNGRNGRNPSTIQFSITLCAVSGQDSMLRRTCVGGSASKALSFLYLVVTYLKRPTLTYSDTYHGNGSYTPSSVAITDLFRYPSLDNQLIIQGLHPLTCSVKRIIPHSLLPTFLGCFRG